MIKVKIANSMLQLNRIRLAIIFNHNINKLIRCQGYLINQSDFQQQNNMNKTLRAASLPHLKPLQQASFKHLINSMLKPLKSLKAEQIIQVGSYVINKQHLLGRGFCSSVYKGKQIKTGRDFDNTGEIFAVKIIDFDKVKGPIQKRLIKNEIKNLHELKKAKNILKLYQVLATNEYVAFITQICKQSLLQKLKSNNGLKKEPLSRDDAFKILKQILIGYHSMREHDLLHRDIKPANILMGQDGQARLGDFGFSIRDDQVQKDKNVNIGSPLYMAPEVLKGNKYSSKADMWSIGLIFLQMLIGDLPWANIKQCNLHEKLLEINIRDYIPLDLGASHTEMLLKSLDIDPRKRIGVRQMMGYLFSKEQLAKVTNQILSHSAYEPSVKEGKSSIPTNITENEGNKNQEAINYPVFQRSSNVRNLYKTNINKFAGNPLNRSSKMLSSRKSIRVKDNIDNRAQTPMALKLKMKGPQYQQLILKQQMSQLHLCRFLFKLIQLITKSMDNIHITYFNFTDKICVELAQIILFTLQEIRLIKSEYNLAAVREFRKSKQFRKMLQLTQQYESNYVQFFQIQLKSQVQSRQIHRDYLIEQLCEYLRNGKEHFELIMEEVEKSQLKTISDEQICQFAHVIDFMVKLSHLLKLKKKGRETFIKYSKVEELANCSLGSLSVSELRKIYQRIQN